MIRVGFLICLVILFACTSNKDVVKIEDVESPSDSTEYAIIIDEPGYESWLVSYAKPDWYYEKSYYHQWNTLYTKEFNHKVRTGEFDHPFNEYIEYDPTVDYGLEVEYKLFWYFKFIEDKYDVKLNISSR
jgi:hypothetical protein